MHPTHLKVAIYGNVAGLWGFKPRDGESPRMADQRRALLTNTERDRIAGDGPNQPRYEAVSRVRRKINEELPADVTLLREHHPQLLEELRAVVCDESEEKL